MNQYTFIKMWLDNDNVNKTDERIHLLKSVSHDSLLAAGIVH